MVAGAQCALVPRAILVLALVASGVPAAWGDKAGWYLDAEPLEVSAIDEYRGSRPESLVSSESEVAFWHVGMFPPEGARMRRTLQPMCPEGLAHDCMRPAAHRACQVRTLQQGSHSQEKGGADGTHARASQQTHAAPRTPNMRLHHHPPPPPSPHPPPPTCGMQGANKASKAPAVSTRGSCASASSATPPVAEGPFFKVGVSVASTRALPQATVNPE